MRDLEEKEKELNKLKTKAEVLLSNNHPASDKIEVWLCFCIFNISRLFTGFVLRNICLATGLYGHFTDPVELASPDHKVHRQPFEGECCLQPSKCPVLLAFIRN